MSIDKAVAMDMQDTARGRGAVGARAVVPRVIKRDLSPAEAGRVLDFGCGETQRHVKSLRAEGYEVYGHDFGVNELYKYQAGWDTVYASNVLNVQPNKQVLRETLETLKSLMDEDTTLIANYASSPRKAGLYVRELREILEKHFKSIERVKLNSNIIWELKGAVNYV